MYRPADKGDQDDLINSNHLDKKRGDETPIFVRAAHRSLYLNDVDHEIQPSSEKPLNPTSSKLTKREKWMIAGIVLLTILLIIFIVLFAKAKGKQVMISESQSGKPSKASITLAAGKSFSSQASLFLRFLLVQVLRY